MKGRPEFYRDTVRALQQYCRARRCPVFMADYAEHCKVSGHTLQPAEMRVLITLRPGNEDIRVNMVRIDGQIKTTYAAR